MSKQKLLAAKALINDKRYDEARLLLKKIDHPTAKVWLKKLDKLSPPKRKINVRYIGIGLVSLFVVVAVGLVAISMPNSNDTPMPTLIPTTTSESIDLIVSPTQESTLASVQNVDDSNLTQHVKDFCMRQQGEDSCSEIALLTLSSASTEMSLCNESSGNNLDDFGSCIRPQYAVAYDIVMRPIVSLSALDNWCSSNDLNAQDLAHLQSVDQCSAWAKNQLSSNVAVVNQCYDESLGYERIADLSDEQFADAAVVYAVCVANVPIIPQA